MNEPVSWRRLIPLGLAVLFTAGTLYYSAIWMYSARWHTPVSFGVEFEQESLDIASIEPAGPADVAGLRPLDRLVAINGEPVESRLALSDTMRHMSPDTLIRLTVNLAGLNRLRSFYTILAPASTTGDGSWVRIVARELVRSYPLLFLLVVVTVLFMRFDSRDAWLMALALSGMIVAWLPLSFEGLAPDMRGFSFAFKVLLGGLSPSLLFYFFAVFPSHSPLDETEPRIKELFFLVSLSVVVPAALWVFVSPTVTQGPVGRFGFWCFVLASVAAVIGAVISLVGNLLCPESEKEVPKIQVVTWGAVAALAPAALLGIASLFLDRSVPLWIATPIILSTLLLPAILGYAMIARDVPYPPQLLQSSARFLLVQRGHWIVLLFIGSAIALPLAEWMHGLLRDRVGIALELALGFGAALVAALVWAGMRGHQRVSQQIDRLLFPEFSQSTQPLDPVEEQQ